MEKTLKYVRDKQLYKLFFFAAKKLAEIFFYKINKYKSILYVIITFPIIYFDQFNFTN